MPGNININISKLPESPWFWLLVAIAIFLILLASDHVATAVVFFFAGVGIICLIFNFFSTTPNSTLWWVGLICLALALILGLIFDYPENGKQKQSKQYQNKSQQKPLPNRERYYIHLPSSLYLN